VYALSLTFGRSYCFKWICYGFSRRSQILGLTSSKVGSKGRTFIENDLSRDLSNVMPSVKSILLMNRRTSRALLNLKKYSDGQL